MKKLRSAPAGRVLALAALSPLMFAFGACERPGASDGKNGAIHPFALPEVVIALSDGEPTFRPLRQFSLTLTAASTLFIIVFLATPLIAFYLLVIQDLTPAVAAISRQGLLIAWTGTYVRLPR